MLERLDVRRIRRLSASVRASAGPTLVPGGSVTVTSCLAVGEYGVDEPRCRYVALKIAVEAAKVAVSADEHHAAGEQRRSRQHAAATVSASGPASGRVSNSDRSPTVAKEALGETPGEETPPIQMSAGPRMPNS